MIACPKCGAEYEPTVQPLTVRQKQVWEYILWFMAAHGLSPTHQEIQDHFGFKSPATVHEHITNLVAKGYLHRDYNRARGLSAVA